MFDERSADWLLPLGCLAAALYWMERRRTRHTLAIVTQRGELEMERQQRELERLNRIVQLSQLSGPLTHEISQPLTSILSNIEAALRLLAAQSADRASITEIMEDIAAQAHNARLLVHSVHSLLQRGQTAPRPLDLNRLIVDTISFLRPALEERHVSVRYSLASDLPAVPADSVQMQQVFLNLITNACDAMAPIAPERRNLTITTALTDDGAVECAVRDSGIGIPAESLHRIFDSYFTTKDDGLGLGLGICRTILCAHGGSLWAVNNATDDGTAGATFLFRLQRAAS